MDHLRRALAPISDEGWRQIDDAAAQALRQYLAGRALIDFTGPKGWAHSAEPLGRFTEVPSPVEGTEAALRFSQPLAEVRTPFSLALDQLDRIDRGAPDPDLDAVVAAAKSAARAEDTAIFEGAESLSVAGIAGVSPHQALAIASDYNDYPSVVAQAVALLKRSGIEGPYAIALGERCYTGVIETTEQGGYPLLEHLRLILGGQVIWAPAVDGAVVLSVRGGDYEFVSGQDFAVGYRAATATEVQLYLEESFTVVIREPRAAVALRYAK